MNRERIDRGSWTSLIREEPRKPVDTAWAREALVLAGENGKSRNGGGNYGEWPDGYFERTAGALAGEPFERPSEGSAPDREAW